LLCAPALADPGPDVSAAAVHGRYEALERLADGSTANRETGALDGGRLRAGWRDAAWALDVALERLTGRVDYQGRSQLGWPIRSHTRLAVDEMMLESRWAGLDTRPVDIALVAALGQRRITRRIAPTWLSTPLTEALDWRFAQAGALARWAPGEGWMLEAEARIEQGLDARLAVDFHGQADAVDLRPGTGTLGQRVEIGLGRQFGLAGGIALALNLRASQARQPYGASPWVAHHRAGQVIGQVRYPGSTQRLDAVMLALDLRWH
jgi:hypothetical protein